MTTRSRTTETYHPWTTYIAAREEARRRGNRRVGTEHLVLGLLHDPEIASALGVTLDSAREALDLLDRQALDAIGIAPALDAPPLPGRDQPPRPNLKEVLKDRLALTPAAKSGLQEAGKPMRRGKHIVPQEVLVVVLACEPPDPAAALFAALGVDTAAARQRLATPPAAA
jgi:ATP-dependent Clp protease ATP-binding subunit ClpA